MGSADGTKASTNMADDKLKPCPFCGDKRTEFNSGYKCYRTDCGGAGPMYSDPEKALDKWNNAWAHKRIAELERKLHMSDLNFNNLEAKLKTAEEALAAYEGMDERFKAQQKRTHELEKALDDLGKYKERR